LSGFRERFHQCLASRADAMFGLTEAVLYADGALAETASAQVR
jgi:hypothetical protein